MLHKSQKLLWLCLFFIGGIFGAEFFHPLLFFLVLFIGLIKNFKFIFLVFCAGSFYFGIFYSQQAWPKPNPYLGQEIIWSGTIVREPDFRQSYVLYTLRSASFEHLVQVKASLYPHYQYGDLLEVRGLLSLPANQADFAYDKYLARYGINALANYPDLKLISRRPGNILLSGIYNFKNQCQKNLADVFVSPAAEFMAGLLLGFKKGLPLDLSQAFQATGTIHILVVSGQHVLIISSILSQGLKYLFIPQAKKIYFMVLILSAFIIFTGAAPSVVRAALMALVLLLAEKFGRPKSSFNILILVAALMLIQNPLILVYDLGFQLSFLATFGLVYLAPPLEKILFFVPKFLGLRYLLATSLGAIIFTSPLIAYQFGTFSVVAPLANLLILPFISLLMGTGFFILFLSFISLDLARLFGWGATLIIDLVIKIAQFLAGLPWSQINI